jgi:hypothetical protein
VGYPAQPGFEVEIRLTWLLPRSSCVASRRLEVKRISGRAVEDYLKSWMEVHRRLFEGYELCLAS